MKLVKVAKVGEPSFASLTTYCSPDQEAPKMWLLVKGLNGLCKYGVATHPETKSRQSFFQLYYWPGSGFPGSQPVLIHTYSHVSHIMPSKTTNKSVFSGIRMRLGKAATADVELVEVAD